MDIMERKHYRSSHPSSPDDIPTNQPRTLRRQDYNRTGDDPYSDEEMALIQEYHRREKERELLSRREAIKNAKRIVVGGVAAIIAVKGVFELTKIAATKMDEAYWAERPFHDSGEVITLEWGDTWLNKMYIPVANKYKGISVEDVEYASRQLNKDYDEKGIDLNGKPSKGLGNTDLAGSSKRVPAFDVELADSSDSDN